MKLQEYYKLSAANLIDEAARIYNDRAEQGRYLKVTSRATHSGKLINSRVYPGKSVKDAAPTFYKSSKSNFDKPFLLNHNGSSDAIGRVVDAKYTQTATGKAFSEDYITPTEEGSGFLTVTSNIVDEEAIAKMLDRRYMTVSTSARSDKLYCSRCTKNQGKLTQFFATLTTKDDSEDSRCDHFYTYLYSRWDDDKDEGIYGITGNLEYIEISQVNDPADDDAQHLLMEVVEEGVSNGLISDSDKSKYLLEFNDRAKDTSVERKPNLIDAKADFSIVDSSGNLIANLNADKYEKNKLISIPTKEVELPLTDNTFKTGETKDEPLIRTGGQSLIDETLTRNDYGELAVIEHLRVLNFVSLSDESAVLLKKLMEDTDRKIKEEYNKKDGFLITHEKIPFSYKDEAEYVFTKKIIEECASSSIMCPKTFISALDSQANKQFPTNDEDTRMDEIDMLNKALRDSQAKVESLDAICTKSDKQLQDAISDNKRLAEENAKMKDSLHDESVNRILLLREELGMYDSVFSSEVNEDNVKSAKAKNKKRFMDMSPESIKYVLDDLRSQKAYEDSRTKDIESIPDPTLADSNVESNIVKDESKDSAEGETFKSFDNKTFI